jgi:DNA-binding NtrC family response regulator
LRSEAAGTGLVTEELTTLKQMEHLYIDHVLKQTRWNKSRTSEVLGITRPTLDKKIKDYGLIDPRKQRDRPEQESVSGTG